MKKRDSSRAGALRKALGAYKEIIRDYWRDLLAIFLLSFLASMVVTCSTTMLLRS